MTQRHDHPRVPFECQMCCRPFRTLPPLFCLGGCNALLFCSVACRTAFSSSGAHDSAQCARMKAQVGDTLRLRREGFPADFTWLDAATRGIDVGETTACDVLERLQVHGRGPWRHLCDCFDDNDRNHLYVPSRELDLPAPRSWTRDEALALLGYTGSWADYYRMRNLFLGHPFALAADHILTIAHAVAMYAPEPHNLMAAPLVLHYLGPRHEFCDPLLVHELRWLLVECLGYSSVVLRAIGPEVESKNYGGDCHEGSRSNGVGGLALLFHAVYYHSFLQSTAESPHVILALNAGFAAYPGSWAETLDAVGYRGSTCPFFVTDYCAEAFEETPAGHIHHVRPSPFRRPMSWRGRNNTLPSYSNGFEGLVAVYPRCSNGSE